MKNQSAKYFKYAIGEIVLVVIGILIALQINTWNEKRKEKINGISFLTNIKNDLAQDTLQFYEIANSVNSVIEDTKTLLRIKDFNHENIDSLISKLPIVYYEYNINSQTYSKLINSGITELSDSKALFDSINLYYTGVQSYFNSVRDWDIQETNEDEGVFLKDAFEISVSGFSGEVEDETYDFFQNDNERKEGFVKLITSVEGRNKLRSSLYRKTRIKATYNGTANKAKNLISLIDAKLQE